MTLFPLLFWLGSAADSRPHTLITTTLFKYIAAATREVQCISRAASKLEGGRIDTDIFE